MSLNELAKTIHENAKAKGWWDTERPVSEIIALIHSELSEALEEARCGRMHAYYVDKEFPNSPLPEGQVSLLAEKSPARYKPEGLPIELADVIIRVLDYAHHMGYNMDALVKLKMRYNETRPHKHGKIF